MLHIAQPFHLRPQTPLSLTFILQVQQLLDLLRSVVLDGVRLLEGGLDVGLDLLQGRFDDVLGGVHRRLDVGAGRLDGRRNRRAHVLLRGVDDLQNHLEEWGEGGEALDESECGLVASCQVKVSVEEPDRELQ